MGVSMCSADNSETYLVKDEHKTYENIWKSEVLISVCGFSICIFAGLDRPQ